MAYLAIVNRRQAAVAETDQLAADLMAVARRRGMNDYLGVAQAAQGWVAWLTGDLASAERLCRDALETWKRLSFPYPFQWTAGLVVLALSADRDPDHATLDLVRLLRDPPQIQLPDPVHEALDQALAADTGTTARAALQSAVDHARDLGFL